MFNWLKYVTVLPKLINLVREVLDLVRHGEDLLAGGGRGAEKKALVLAILTQAIDTADTLGIPEAKGIDRNKLRAVVGEVIDGLVLVLNQLGVFKHTPTPTAP